MIIERAYVRVGMEIEIAAFNGRVTYQDVARELVSKGFMLGNASNWSEYHTYGCACELGCGDVRSGDVLIPPLVSLTYDASLPRTGAEFVTSAILFGEGGLEPLKEIWEIVVRDAYWIDTLKDRRGNPASPSVHLHISATNPNLDKTSITRTLAQQARSDIRQALALYAPEFIAMAATAELKRGLTYRQPTRYDDGHHGFINVKKVIPNQSVYIEWRMFEAAYHSWEYVEACAYVTATLTRALLSPTSFNALMTNGYADPVNEEELATLTSNNDVDGVIQVVSHQRLGFLRQHCIEQLDDDERGQGLIDLLFDKTEDLC